MAKKIRQPKTYALYKKEIYSWVDLLKELDLEHNDNANARPEFYKQASSKQLKAVKCMIKDDDEEYIEICNECGELIDDCTCNNNDVNKYCNECGELIDDCTCEGDNQDNNENNEYIISNDKKIVTCAQLPNGKCIKWVELLEMHDLDHNPRRSAYEEWKEYKRDSTKKLPEVKRVDKNGNNILDKEKPKITQAIKRLVWTKYFPKTLKGICPCCKDIKDNEINFGWFIIGHNIPVSKGGSSEPDNLVPICGECNQGMGNKYSIVEWRKILLSTKGKLVV
ncbi:MAG: HNH endonuclease [Candidatus Methanoperedens sp.]|nr:HNH endonuclease [Candidatus Methanoperedens sp.]